MCCCNKKNEQFVSHERQRQRQRQRACLALHKEEEEEPRGLERIAATQILYPGAIRAGKSTLNQVPVLIWLIEYAWGNTPLNCSHTSVCTSIETQKYFKNRKSTEYRTKTPLNQPTAAPTSLIINSPNLDIGPRYRPQQTKTPIQFNYFA